MRPEFGSIWVHEATGVQFVVLDTEDLGDFPNGYQLITGMSEYDAQEQVAASLAEYALLVHERDAVRESINARTELLNAMVVHYEALAAAVIDAWADYLQANEVWEQAKQ